MNLCQKPLSVLRQRKKLEATSSTSRRGPATHRTRRARFWRCGILSNSGSAVRRVKPNSGSHRDSVNLLPASLRLALLARA
eukprot:409489-Rhodomonas_salina.2